MALAGSLLQEGLGLLTKLLQPAHLVCWFCRSAFNLAPPAAFSHGDEPNDLLSVFLETSTDMRERGLASGPSLRQGSCGAAHWPSVQLRCRGPACVSSSQRHSRALVSEPLSHPHLAGSRQQQ